MHVPNIVFSENKYIPAVGHQSVVIKKEENFAILYLGGQQSDRCFGLSSFLFNQEVGSDYNDVWLEDLSYVKPNQLTTHSGRSFMSGSILENLSNFRMVNLVENPKKFELLIYGGEMLTTGITSSDIYILEGTLDPFTVKCKKFTRDPLMPVPGKKEWDSHLEERVQLGMDKPVSRMGHCLHKVGDGKLFMFGGMEVPDVENLRNRRTLSDAWLFDVESMTWLAISDDIGTY